MKSWFQDWEVSHLASKAVGMLGSVVASHLAVITTTPEYAHFWASWYMTAPTITNKTGFEEKLTAMFATAWLAGDHFLWKFIENQKVTGSPTIQVEKSAPPQSPTNPIQVGERKEDPKGETK